MFFSSSQQSKKQKARSLLPPPNLVQCAEYVPRTGAFAYLVDRCARCNAKQEQHNKKPQFPYRQRNAGDLQYWLLRDIATDSGWSLQSRLQVMHDTCVNLQEMHAVGLCYGPTLRATAIMCSSQGHGALRRPLVMLPKMDPYETLHVERCLQDMLYFGKLLQLVCGANTHSNDSLNVLIEQLLEAEENRPDAETCSGWLEGIIQDLDGPFEVPKFSSSRHPFYGFIDLVTKENLQAIVNKTEENGYESDDSFHPLAGGGGGGGEEEDGSDQEKSSAGEETDGNESDASTSTRSRGGSISKLGSFLAETISSAKRRSSADSDGGSATKPQPPPTKKKPREFRPLSSATRNNFKLSYGKTHLRVKVPTPKQIAKLFDAQERISPEAASALLQQSEVMMRRERNILEINDRQRVQIFGDIHGQYFDLRHALETSGYSLEDECEDRTLLFMGDYVDRGAWSCEVLFFLLALKLARPSRVFLLRGNHECGAVVSFFGFKEEMECKYGQTLFNKSLLTFQAMPLCAIVSTVNKRWLVCHGGISPKLEDIYQDVGAINRFSEPGMNGLFCDLLWADPQMEIEEFAANPSRGCSVRFGIVALRKCLEANVLDGLIRGHEVMEDGVGFADQVVTVFSAPNYCGRYGNRGAYLYVHPDRDDVEAVRFDSVTNQPHPRTFDSVVVETNSRIVETLPFMPTTLGGFVNRALDLYSATAAKQAQEQNQAAKRISSRRFVMDEEEDDDEDEEDEDEEELVLDQDESICRDLNEEQQPLLDNDQTAPLSANVEDNDNTLVEVDNSVLEDNSIVAENGAPSKVTENEAPSEVTEPASLVADEPPVEKKEEGGELALQPPTSPKRSAFNLAKNRLSKALSINKRFQAAKYSDGINEAHPSLTQFKIQSAELLLRMRFRKPQPAAPATPSSSEEISAPPHKDAQPEEDGPITALPAPTFHHHQRSRSAAINLSQLDDDDTLPLNEPASDMSVLLDPPASQEQQQPTTTRRRVHSMDRLTTAALAAATPSTSHLLNMSVDSVYVTSPRRASMRKSKRKRNAAELLLTPLGTLLSEVYPPIELESHRPSTPPPPPPAAATQETDTPKSFHGSSSFSDSELRDLQLLFMLVDRSDDAKITHEEIMQWSKDEGEQVSEQDAKRVVEAVDADRDGVIGLDDWLWFAHCCREVYNAEIEEEEQPQEL